MYNCCSATVDTQPLSVGGWRSLRRWCVRARSHKVADAVRRRVLTVAHQLHM